MRRRALNLVSRWAAGGTWQMQTRMFELGEAAGAHILPVHFYSPVPDVSRLDDAIWDRIYISVASQS